MATLNVKNFPDHLYQLLQERAARDRRSVAQEVAYLLDAALNESEPLSILPLRGLGKAQWKGVDAAAHVERERTSWD